MNIGSTIKSYRKKIGLTQEQVAAAVGVSKPAVSKWESCNAYPDITLLAPLARLFGTTVDNLLEYNMYLSEEQIQAIITKFENSLSTLGWDKAISYAESQLHQYPNVYGLKISIAVSYFQNAILSSDIAFQEKAIPRSFELLQQVIRCNEHEHKEMALNHLSHNALLLHRYDEALDAAKQLPQEKVETEILLATIYFHRGDYDLCKLLSQKILFRSYKNCDLSLGLLEKVSFSEEKYSDELALLNKHICFCKLFGVNSSHSLYLEMAEVYARMDDKNKTIELLNNYVTALEDGEILDKYPFFDLLDIDLTSNDDFTKSAFSQLANYLSSNALFLSLSDNDKFKKIVDKIRNHK